MNRSSANPSVDSPTWTATFTPAAIARIAVLAVLFLLVYGPTILQNLIHRWQRDANWSHGWLIPAFSAYLLWSRRKALRQVRPAPSYAGAALLLLSLAVFFFFAWRAPMTYPRALSLVGALFGLTLLMGGWGIMRVAWFPILFLCLAVPLPERLYVSLTMPLRAFASAAAAAIMPWFATGLYTEAQTVVIDYVMPGRPPGQLNVEEACSGMRSLMALVTLGVAMAYLGDRPWWQRIVMVASCLPIAILCNTIRVTITGLLYVLGHKDFAQGTPHELLGIVLLGLGLGLFWLTGYVLANLFVTESEEETTV